MVGCLPERERVTKGEDGWGGIVAKQDSKKIYKYINKPWELTGKINNSGNGCRFWKSNSSLFEYDWFIRFVSLAVKNQLLNTI